MLPPAKLVLLFEKRDAEERLTGEALSGRTGMLLKKLLGRAGLTRKDVKILYADDLRGEKLAGKGLIVFGLGLKKLLKNVEIPTLLLSHPIYILRRGQKYHDKLVDQLKEFNASL